MKTEILITQMSINYDKKLNVTSVNYATTIPTSVPIELALELISDIVCFNLSHVERINGLNVSYGTLEGITKDMGQERYCFSVSKCPNNLEKTEFLFETDLS